MDVLDGVDGMDGVVSRAVWSEATQSEDAGMPAMFYKYALMALHSKCGSCALAYGSAVERFSFCFCFPTVFTVGYPISRLRRFRSRGGLRSHTRNQISSQHSASAKPDSKTNDTKRGPHLIT